MKRGNIENKIRLNALLIYIVVLFACGGVVMYLYKLNERAAQQKESIERYNATLMLTNDLIAGVQEAQSLANLYLFSRNRSYLNDFHVVATSVGRQIDSLIAQLPEQTQQYATLRDVTPLFRKKEATIAELAKHFDEYGVLDTINRALLRYEPIVKTDSVMVTTTYQDTVMMEEPKAGFWKKLGSLFSSSSPTELKYNVVTTTRVETRTNMELDTAALLANARKISERKSKSYSQKLKSIEQQLSTLMLADQELSEEISLLLIKLHRQTLSSTFDEMQKSELLLKKNYRLSLVFAAVAMLVILFFIFLIINDVNKGRAANEALELEKKRTEDLMHSRHELLLSVSHDIKAPLTSVLGYLELWGKEESALTTKQQQWLLSMRNAGEHILALLANLLEFSRLEQGKLQLYGSSFDVEMLCKEVVEMFTPLVQQKGLTFEHKCNVEKLRYVHSDRLKIKQVVVNLLSNAIKYTQRGKIELEVSEKNAALYLRISDTGIGMSKVFVEEAFAPFARAENIHVVEGSGLGLYVVKGLVNILQGKVIIHSEQNVGTTIEVTLPVEASTAEAVNVTHEKAENLIVNRCNVLVVDDDVTLLTMLGELLHSVGSKAILCKNLQEFEAQIPHLSSFDLVLTDMNMGTISGKDILRMVHEISSSVPVFVMTAYGDYSSEKAAADGFSGYLAKPFSLHLLAGLLGKQSRSGVPLNVSDGNFSELLSLFDNDRKAVQNILKIFAEDTVRHLALLKKYVKDNDFSATQALCHKMLPMFVQLGENDLAAVLKKMDLLRGKSEGHFPSWRKAIKKFTGKAASLLEKIERF